MGVVRRLNAVANNICGIRGPRVNLHTTPRHMPPVNVTVDEQLFPARHDAGENGPFDR